MSATSFVIDVDPIVVEKVEQECRQLLESEVQINDTLLCPGTFDGWACWNSTPAGVTAYQRCPFYVTGFTPRKRARRECLPDGTWFRHPESNLSWSNYTTCLDTESFEVWQKVNGVYIIGYSVSLAALVLALLIYSTFRSLRCSRVKIHKNLFTAFVITNMMFLVWHSSIVPDPDILLENPIWCQIWHIMAHYFLLCNHLWMLFEGFYLHTILVVTFVDENHLIRWFYLLGWSAPLPFIVGYVLLRTTRVGEGGDLIDIKACWLRENNEAKWILVTPIIISLLANMIFLINIVRVLFTKLRNMPGGHSHCKRATNHFASQDEYTKSSHQEGPFCGDALLIVEANVDHKDHKRNKARKGSPGTMDRRTSAVTFSRNVVHLDELEGTQNGSQFTQLKGTTTRLLNGRTTINRQNSNNTNCPCGYKKAVRAALILIPLLGLHYVLVPFYEDEAVNYEDLPPLDDDSAAPGTLHIAYQIILAVTASFQGLFVALLFCLLNGEVIQAFKKKWNQRRQRTKEASACSRTVSLKILRPPGNITRTSWDQEID